MHLETPEPTPAMFAAPPVDRLPSASATFWLPTDAIRVTPALTRDLRCQVAIVGGGYAGLSAAYHLKRLDANLDVALFDAGVIGVGASGLNSGQCGPRIGPPIEQQVRTLGETLAAACYRQSLWAMQRTGALIKEEKIDCDLTACEQLQVAFDETHAQLLARRASLYQRLGFEVGFLDRAALRRRLPGAPRLAGALAFPAFTLNPGRLCIGLKAAAQRYGVRIHEQTRVEQITFGSRIGLRANGHAVEAERLVIANDGFASTLGLFRRSLFPIRVFAATTRVLSEQEHKRLGWSGHDGLYDTRHAFNFLRLTPNGHVLIGGEYCSAASGASAPTQDARRRRALAWELERFFPALRDIEFEECWSGVVGCTLDGWPLIAPLGESGNACYVGAWNGHGVALAPSSGAWVAEQLLQVPTAPDSRFPWQRRAAPSLPMHGLVRVVLPAYLHALWVLDRWHQWRHPGWADTTSAQGAHDGQ